MKPPSAYELTRITAIAAVLCAIALAAAFAGAGATAMIVLVIVVGPATLMLYRKLFDPDAGRAPSADADGQPYVG